MRELSLTAKPDGHPSERVSNPWPSPGVSLRKVNRTQRGVEMGGTATSALLVRHHPDQPSSPLERLSYSDARETFYEDPVTLMQ